MYTALLYLFWFFSMALLSLNTHFSLYTINLPISEPFHSSNKASITIGSKYICQYGLSPAIYLFIRISQTSHFLSAYLQQINNSTQCFSTIYHIHNIINICSIFNIIVQFLIIYSLRFIFYLLQLFSLCTLFSVALSLDLLCGFAVFCSTSTFYYNNQLYTYINFYINRMWINYFTPTPF